MNDTPAPSSDRELQLLVMEIQAGIARQALPEVRDNPKLLAQGRATTRKQIDRLLKGILSRLNTTYLIKQWSGIADIESIVDEAVTITLAKVVKSINSYDPDRVRVPDRSVMAWVNKILYNQFRDLLRKYRSRYESISIDNPDSGAEAKIQEKIDKDDAVIPPSENPDLAEKLRQFIRTDPEDHLKNTHIKNKPNATFQAILLLRLQGLTWQGIANNFDIPRHTTVRSFHDRELRKLNNYFRKYLCRD
jgi:DNA-directed RNA polymerase specialized sigma24 family protein